MNSFDQLNSYLRNLERRLRLTAWARGAAAVALAAVIATVLLVLLSNAYSFSSGSVAASRFLLFLCLAIAACFGIVIPLLQLNRRYAARRAERDFPEFQERLLTFAEKGTNENNDPFLELLAADTVEVTRQAEPRRIVRPAWIAGSVSTAVIGAAILIWLIFAGPGFLGHGSALLWGSQPRTGSQPFYDIVVAPGDSTVRKGGDQEVSANLVGFQTARVRLFARFSTTSKWEETPMLPQQSGPGFQFLFAALAGPVEYYVEAGGLKSKQYKLSVIELPAVKRMRVTYHYPGWVGLKDVVQEQGGDIRAVEGTEAEVAIQTDRPLREGVLVIDGEKRVPLVRGEGTWVSARVPVNADGLYHVAAVEDGKTVRMTEDFFIEVRKDTPPTVALKKPGRDAKVSPIEEVTVELQGEDDFALEGMELHYSVNGGPEKTVPLLAKKGVKQANGATMIALEDYKMVPGDIVSMYATARDARTTTKSDIFFLEAQPFEREYSQSQQSGGGEGEEGGAGEQQNKISQRQKEIIAATWNQTKANSKDRAAAAGNAKFLADVQGKLRDQAKSLAERMGRRQLSGSNQEFSSFSKDMLAAAEAMNAAAGKLSAMNWKDALPAEQRALQHLLRAEATFREIQVAFGNRNSRGGAGGGGAARDLENLFDLELDTEKNQYETGQQAASSAEQRQKDVDEALQKLEQLARRQQELAAQQSQKQNQQTSQQRWQQEMLRREAEELKRQMQQMAQNSSGQQQSRQQQSGQQQSGQQQSGQQQSGQQSSSQAAQGQQSPAQQRLNQLTGRGQSPENERRMQEAMQRLEQATNDMRRASENGQNNADARRAAERLQEARDLVGGARRQQASGQLDDLASRAAQMAGQQKEFVDRLKQTPGDGSPAAVERGSKLASEKEQMMSDLKRLEKDMQNSARDLAGTQRTASSKLREALGDMQQDELALRMKFNADYLRRGYGQQLQQREEIVSAGLNKLRDQVKAAQGALDKGAAGKDGLEKNLAQLERLRGQMQQMGRNGQQQNGQQQGGQQQGGQQQGGQQQGGQQQGGQQEGGRQGGQQQGGRQQGALNGGWGGYREGSLGNRYENLPAEAIRNLNELRQGLREDPEAVREIDRIIGDFQRMDARKLGSDPVLDERIRTSVLPSIEQLELQLRRKLEEQQAGQVRSGAGERIPQGYTESVAEYFRRLSKGK